MRGEGEEAEGRKERIRDLQRKFEPQEASPMTPKAMVAAAAVLVIALSPSIAECVQSHQDANPHTWALWAWIALAAVVAALFGEQMMKGGA